MHYLYIDIFDILLFLIALISCKPNFLPVTEFCRDVLCL